MPSASRREHIVTVTVHELESPALKHGEDYTLKFKRGDTVSTFDPVTAFYNKIKCPTSWRTSAVVHFKSGGKGPNGFQPKIVSLELHQMVKGGKSSKQAGTIQFDVTAALDDGKQRGARRQVKYTFRASSTGGEVVVDMQVYPTGELPPDLPEETGLPVPVSKYDADGKRSASTPEDEEDAQLDEAGKVRAAELQQQVDLHKRLLAAVEKANKANAELIRLNLTKRAELVANKAIKTDGFVAAVDPSERTLAHNQALRELKIAQERLDSAKAAHANAAIALKQWIDLKMPVHASVAARREELIATRERLNKEQRERDVSEEAVAVMCELDEIEAKLLPEEVRLSREGIVQERERLNEIVSQCTALVKTEEAAVEPLQESAKAHDKPELDLAASARAENKRAAEEAAKELTLYLAMCATPEGYADLKDCAAAKQQQAAVASSAAAPAAKKNVFDAFGAMENTTSECAALSATVTSLNGRASPQAHVADLFSCNTTPSLARCQSPGASASISGQRSHGDDLFGSVSSAASPPKYHQEESPHAMPRGARASAVPLPADMDIFGAPLEPVAPGPSNNMPIGRTPAPQQPTIGVHAAVVAAAVAPATPPAASLSPARSPSAYTCPDFFSGIPEKAPVVATRDASQPRAVWADDASLFGPTATMQTARPAFFGAPMTMGAMSSEANNQWAPGQSQSVGGMDMSSQSATIRGLNENDLFADVMPTKQYPTQLHPAHMTVRATTPPLSQQQYQPQQQQQVDLFATAPRSTTPSPQKKAAFDPFGAGGFGSDVPDDQLFA